MYEVRPAALNEFSLLPEIEAESDTIFESLNPPISLSELPAPGDSASYADALHIMVAGRPPLAFARLELVDSQAHLEQLSVIPGAAKKGIGRSLVVAAKAWAKESGFSRITLCTFSQIPFNAPFYAQCGFVELPIDRYGPELRGLREIEERLGLDALGPRIAMVSSL